MSRVRELLDEIHQLQHGAEDISDLLDTWGLTGNEAALDVQQAMLLVLTATELAGRRVVAEAAKFPEDDGRRRGAFIVTVTGKRFWPLDPRADEVDPYDIAHALTYKCRWGAHCEPFYSVAEHSLNVAKIAREIALREGYPEPEVAATYARLHDAEEAYLPDVPRPIKKHLKGWGRIAAPIQEAIWEAFKLPPPPAEVAEFVDRADDYALLIESRALFRHAEAATWIGGLPDRVLPNWVSLMAVRGPKFDVIRRGLLAQLEAVFHRREPFRDLFQNMGLPAAEPSAEGGSWKGEVAAVAESGNVHCMVCCEPGANPVFKLCKACS